MFRKELVSKNSGIHSKNKLKTKNRFLPEFSLILFVITFALPSSFYFSFAFGEEGNLQSSNGNALAQKYIIELDEKPLITLYHNKSLASHKIKDLSPNNLNLNSRALTSESVNEKVDKIKRKQDETLSQILSIRQKKRKNMKISLLNSKNKIKRFSRVFSGLVVELTPEEVEEVKKLPHVKSVELDKTLKLYVPEVKHESTDFSSIDLNALSGINYTGKGITVAVVDSGIDYTHLDLGNCTLAMLLNKTCDKIIDGYDFGEDDDDPMDDFGHGTHCAGIIAANGSIKGVAPDAKLLAYKVSYFDSQSYLTIPISAIIEAFERALDPNQDLDFSDHADIISLSLGAYSGWANDFLSRIVDEVVKAGMIVSAAAGNEGNSSYIISTPSTSREAISVAAYDEGTGSIASFSSSGPAYVWQMGSSPSSASFIFKPEIAAPGVDILSTVPKSGCKLDPVEGNLCSPLGYLPASGTSAATPYVAGVAALILQKAREQNLSLTSRDVKSLIIQYARDLGEPLYRQGAGLINASRSLNGKIIFDPPVINFEDIVITPFSHRNLTVKNLDNIPHTLYINLSSLGSYSDYLILSENNFTIPAKETYDLTVSVNPLKKVNSEMMFLIDVQDSANNSIQKLTLPAMISSFKLTSFGRNLTIKLVSDALNCDELKKDSDLHIFLANKVQAGFSYFQSFEILPNLLDDSCSFNLTMDNSIYSNYSVVLFGSIESNNTLDYFLVPEDLSYFGVDSQTLIFNLSNLASEEVPLSVVGNSFLRRATLNLVFHNASQAYDLNNNYELVNYEFQQVYDYPLPKDNQQVFFNYKTYDLASTPYNYNLSFELWFEWIKPQLNGTTINQTVLSLNQSLPHINFDIYLYKKTFLNKLNESILQLNLNDLQNYSITQKIPFDISQDYFAYRKIQYVNKYGINRIEPIKDKLTVGAYKVFEIKPDEDASFVIVNEYGGKNKSFMREIYGKEFDNFYKGFPDYKIIANDQKVSFKSTVTLGLPRFSILPLSRFFYLSQQNQTSASFLKAPGSDHLIVTNYQLYTKNSSHEQTDFFEAAANPLVVGGIFIYPACFFLSDLDFKEPAGNNLIRLNYSFPGYSSFENTIAFLSFDPSCSVFPDIENLTYSEKDNLLNISFDYYLTNSHTLNVSKFFIKNNSLVKESLNVTCLNPGSNHYSCYSLINLSESNVTSLNLSIRLKDDICYNLEEINISPFYVKPQPLFINISHINFTSRNISFAFNITTLDGSIVENIPIKLFFNDKPLSEFLATRNSRVNLTLNTTSLSNLTFEIAENYPYQPLNVTYQFLNAFLISPKTSQITNDTLLINVSSDAAEQCNYNLVWLYNNSTVSEGPLIKNNSYFYAAIPLGNEGNYSLNISCNNSLDESFWFVKKTLFVDYLNPKYNVSLNGNLTAGKRTTGTILVNDTSPQVYFNLRILDPFNNLVYMLNGTSKSYNLSFTPWEIGNYTFLVNITDLFGHCNNSQHIFYSKRPENVSVALNVTSENLSLILEEVDAFLNTSENQYLNLTTSNPGDLTIVVITNNSLEAKIVFQNISVAELNLTLSFIKNISNRSIIKKIVGVETAIPKLHSRLIFNVSDLNEDLDKLVAFKCYNWSASNHSCQGNWSRYQNYTLDFNNFEFQINANSFSAYSVGESFCGDMVCDFDEDCSSCPTDCGVCPPQSPDSGDFSGGGASTSGSNDFIEPSCDFSQEYYSRELFDGIKLENLNLSPLISFSIFDFNLKGFTKLLLCFNQQNLDDFENNVEEPLKLEFSNLSQDAEVYLYNISAYLKDSFGRYTQTTSLTLNLTFSDFCSNGPCNFTIYAFEQNAETVEKTYSFICSNLSCEFDILVPPKLIMLRKQVLELIHEEINQNNSVNISNFSKNPAARNSNHSFNKTRQQPLQFIELNNAKKQKNASCFNTIAYWMKYTLYVVSTSLAHPFIVGLLTILIVLLLFLLILWPIVAKQRNARLYLQLNQEISRFERHLKLNDFVPSADILLRMTDLEDIIKKKKFYDLYRRLERILQKAKLIEKEK